MKTIFEGRETPRSLTRAEDGMVSVETAVTMPVIVMVLALILVASRYGINQVQACNQARNEARQMAISQFVGETRDFGAAAVPLHSGERIETLRKDGQIFVTVHPRSVSFLGVVLPQTGCTVSFWDEGD